MKEEEEEEFLFGFLYGRLGRGRGDRCENRNNMDVINKIVLDLNNILMNLFKIIDKV